MNNIIKKIFGKSIVIVLIAIVFLLPKSVYGQMPYAGYYGGDIFINIGFSPSVAFIQAGQSVVYTATAFQSPHPTVTATGGNTNIDPTLDNPHLNAAISHIEIWKGETGPATKIGESNSSTTSVTMKFDIAPGQNIYVIATDAENNSTTNRYEVAITPPTMFDTGLINLPYDGQGFVMASGSRVTINAFVGYSGGNGVENIRVDAKLQTEGLEAEGRSELKDDFLMTNSAGMVSFVLKTTRFYEGTNTVTLTCLGVPTLPNRTLVFNQRNPHHFADTEGQPEVPIEAGRETNVRSTTLFCLSYGGYYYLVNQPAEVDLAPSSLETEIISDPISHVSDVEGKIYARIKTKAGQTGTNNIKFTTAFSETESVTNDVYVSQIASFNENAPHAYAGGIIDTFNGRVSMSVTDMSIPGRGLSLNFTRSYHTMEKPMPFSNASGFYTMDGEGSWNHNYNVYLEDFMGENIRVHSGSGTKEFYSCAERINGLPSGNRYINSLNHSEIIRRGDTGDHIYDLVEKDGTVYRFAQPNGSYKMLSSITDRNGNVITLNYVGLLRSVSDQLGRQIEFEYNAACQVTKITGPNGKEYIYSYDPLSGNLIGVSGEGGKYSAEYSYAGNSGWANSKYRLTGFKEPHMAKGLTDRTIAYDSQAIGGETRACGLYYGFNNMSDPELTIDYSGFLVLDINGRRNSKVTTTAGKTTTYKYGGEVWTNTIDALGNESSYTWDSNYNQLSVRDSLNRITSYTYDQYGNRTQSVTDSTALPNGRIVTTSYVYSTDLIHLSKGLLGLLIKTTDPLGKISLNEYDAKGNLLTTKPQKPEGALTEANTFVSSVNTYSTSGQVVTTVKYFDDTGTKKITTLFEYDNATGQLKKAKLPNLDGVPDDAYSTTAVYDLLSRKTAETDQMGLTTSYTYDDSDRVSQINYADGTNVHYDFDTNGNLATITDAKGVKTKNDYDSRDRLKNVYSALNTPEQSHVEYFYDADNNKTQMKVYDAQAGTIQTDYSYDELNRLKTTTDHPYSNGVSDRVNRFFYDTAGRKVSVIDAKGQATNFVYDDLDRVTTETTILTATGVTLSSNSYTYDIVGNRLTMTDGIGITTSTYDNLYRLVTQTVPTQVKDGATLFNTVTTYNYDLGGNKLSSKVGKSGQTDAWMSTAYEYYDNNWLQREKYKSTPSDNEKNTEYFYDVAGKKKKVTYPNGTETIYDYCHEGTSELSLQNHRLKKLTNRKTINQAIISFFGYTYDEVGNRLTMSELRGLNTYTYDSLYRLKTVLYPDTRAVEYWFDKAGNRTRMVDNVVNPVTRTTSPVETLYTYDNANQMLTATKAGTTTNYAWDLNGNQATKTTGSTAMTCVWNGKDEMTGINYSGGKPENTMVYDGNGKRAEYVSSEGIQKFIYEGNGTIIETNQNGEITKKYNSGISMEKFNLEPNGIKETYYYLCDGLGSVVNLTDERGEVVQTYLYDIYGASTNVKHDPTNKKQFTGKEVDEDSGLIKYGTRYYAPVVGRFISKDKFICDIAPPRGINSYTFSENNPINDAFLDEDGKIPFILAAALVGGGINSVISMTSAVIRGENAVGVLKEGVKGFITGAVGTGVATMAAVGATPLGAVTAGSMASAATGQIVDNIFDKISGKDTKILSLNAEKLGMDTVTGVALGMAVKGISAKALPKPKGAPIKNVFQPLENLKTGELRLTINAMNSANKSTIKEGTKIIKDTVSDEK